MSNHSWVWFGVRATTVSPPYPLCVWERMWCFLGVVSMKCDDVRAELIIDECVFFECVFPSVRRESSGEAGIELVC